MSARIDPDAVPCEVCDEPTLNAGTKRCNSCWEVEKRLETYLSRGSRKALLFVLDTIRKVVGP